MRQRFVFILNFFQLCTHTIIFSTTFLMVLKMLQLSWVDATMMIFVLSLYCFVRFCIPLYYFVRFCFPLYCFVRFCIPLYCSVMFCVSL